MGLLDVTWTPIATNLSTTQVLTTTTLAAFQAWPLSVQASFVKANSGANPPQVVFGPAGQQHLATLTPNGEVEVDPPGGSALPANYTTVQPADLDHGTFTSWSPNMQTAYLQAYGADPSLTLGSGTGTYTATLLEPATSGTPSGTILGTDVAVSITASQQVDVVSTAEGDAVLQQNISAENFLRLPQADQEKIFQLNKQFFDIRLTLGTSSAGPYSMEFSDTSAADPVIALTMDDGSSISVHVPSQTYGTYADDLSNADASTTAPNAVASSVDADVFQGWPPIVQKNYLLSQAQRCAADPTLGQITPGGSTSPPIVVVFGASTRHPNGYTAMLTSGAVGSGVQIADNPVGFATAVKSGAPAPDTFLSWPPGAQLAFTLARTIDPAQSGSRRTLPCNLQAANSSINTTVDLSLSTANASGIAFDYHHGDLTSTDTDLFALLPPQRQYAYFSAYGNDVVGKGGALANPSLLIGPAGHQVIASHDAQQNVTVDAVPAGFSQAPSAISTATFKSWPAAVQQRYLYLQKSAAPAGTAWKGATFSDGLTFTLDATGNAASTQVALLDLDTTPPAVGDSHPYDYVGTTTKATELAAQATQIFSAVAANPWAGQSGTPSAAVFDAWTGEQQAAYIKVATKASGLSYATVGSGSTEQDVFLSSTVSSGGVPKVYTAQNLQKTSIATLSYADQKTLAGIPAFLAIAGGLNLIPAATPSDNYSTDATKAAQTIAALLSAARNLFKNGGTDLNGKSVTTDSMPDVAKAVFTSEIDVISANLFGAALPDAGATAPGDAPALPSPQTAGSAIFSPADIKAELTAIETRFERANAFADVACNVSYSTIQGSTMYDYFLSTNHNADSTKNICSTTDITNALYPGLYYKQGDTYYMLSGDQIRDLAGFPPRGNFGQLLTQSFAPGSSFTSSRDPVNGSPSGLTVYVGGTYGVSQDGRPVMLDQNKSVMNGYVTFMTQEKAILTNRVGAATLANTGRLANSTQNLDLPSLLCLFMMFQSNAQQAVVTADSEEVNQTNAILQDYAVMQSIINTTNSQANGNANLTIYPKIGNADGNAMYMFAQNGKSDYIYNESPIETMYLGPLKRPTFPDYWNGDTAGRNSDWQYTATWTEQGTQLSDTVTQLNQQSQIKMNDITNETKQQDRFFDLASSSLSKLNETLAQIASAT